MQSENLVNVKDLLGCLATVFTIASYGIFVILLLVCFFGSLQGDALKILVIITGVLFVINLLIFFVYLKKRKPKN